MTKARIGQIWTDYYVPYLTDEAIAWLESYVFVLPESRIDFDALRINVSLVDADGLPAIGAKVLICPPEPGGGCGTARTDENGLASKRLGLRGFRLLISVPNADGSDGALSYYSADFPGKLTTDHDAATILHVTDDLLDLTISLPANP